MHDASSAVLTHLSWCPQAPPLATNNETLIAIIAHEDIVNIERVIAVFSPAAAVIFFNR